MILVYPHKQGKEGSTIQHSINWALKRYTNAEVYIIGDHVRGYNNIIPDARSSVRGCDVTHKLLTFARHIGGQFLYMNDDFFIGPKFNEDTVISNGNLIINDIHAPTYQEACQNTTYFPSSGYLFTSGGTVIQYTGKTTTQFTGCTLYRGSDSISIGDQLVPYSIN